MTLKENKIACRRYNSPEKAIRKADKGSGVMILADNYPYQTTELDASLFEKAKEKNLRLYVEFPSYLPDIEIGTPRGTYWERAVISSEAFAPELQKLRILAIHDCRFVPIEVENPDIVIARVAGFDSAVFGLPKEKFPVLVRIPQTGNHEDLLVSTTKLSQFITARYAPNDAWMAIWNNILKWMQPGRAVSELKWTARVRPSYGMNESLPDDVERQTIKRGVDWYFNSKTVVSPSMVEQYDKPATRDESAWLTDPDLTKDWPFGSRINFMPDENMPAGEGSLGIMEGFDAKIFYNGTQPYRWSRRGDCNGEAAGLMALAGVVLNNPEYTKVGGNIGDWLYFNSMISLGDRANPEHPAYGLLGWTDIPQYMGPGTMNCYEVYYGDDQARNMLGMILAGAALKTNRYDERLMKGLLGNLRITGLTGFQPDRIDQHHLVRNGWQFYHYLNTVSYSGNFQAYLWACFLWAYHQTGYDLFLHRAKAGIYRMMDGYPIRWGVTGVQMDRSRMILPLAWLLRIEDTPEHRAWLRTVVADLKQDEKTGTIPERIEPETSNYGRGHYKSPQSNEEYGTTEASIIQSDGDPCCDLLYATNFAFAGLREAAAVTNDKFYIDAENKLAKFLCRVQIRSEAHPELDGGWFRAFDYNRWEYWASSTDAGWGAWCIESGWSQSWIAITFALRQLNTSFWDITSNSNIRKNFESVHRQMFPVQ